MLFSMLTHHITDSIWLAGGTLLIGAGHHMLHLGQCKKPGRKGGKPVGLFERVAWLNGPLPDYHPQMILQCLLWGEKNFHKADIPSSDATQERRSW